MAKAADAFRTIGEVSTELDVPKHVLRFWEAKFKQLRPMKRGGGRRFYRPEDVELLRGIKALLHRDAYTIRGAQRVLRDQGVEWVKALGTTPKDIAAVASAAVTSSAEIQPTAVIPPKARSRKQAVARSATASQPASADRRALINQAIETLIACRALLAPEAAVRPDRQRA